MQETQEYQAVLESWLRSAASDHQQTKFSNSKKQMFFWFFFLRQKGNTIRFFEDDQFCSLFGGSSTSKISTKLDEM